MANYMHVNCDPEHADKVGDVAAAEPALSAFAALNRRPVVLAGLNLRLHDLFRNHPWVIPSTAKINTDITLDTDRAYFAAVEHERPFGAGFFYQFGIDPDGLRQKFAYYGINSERKPDLTRLLGKTVRSIVIPYSYSCTSRDRATGAVNPLARANVQPPVDWWGDVVPRLPQPCYCLVGADRAWNPPFPHAREVRGACLSAVAELLAVAEVVVSVETGLLHLAGGVDANVVYLSSATPAYFAAPNRCKVVRGEWATFDADEVVDAANYYVKK